MFERVIYWLFPHGVGTRAILALIVVVACTAVIAHDPVLAKEVVILVLGWYFLDRGRTNGANGAGANGVNGHDNNVEVTRGNQT